MSTDKTDENKEQAGKEVEKKENTAGAAPENSTSDPADVQGETDVKEMGKASALQHFDYIKETTKQRPLNKKKFLRRTAITVFMAVLFGITACATALFLEPLMSDYFHPTEEPEQISLPPQIQEVLPEDMAFDDTELKEADNSRRQPESKKNADPDPLYTYKSINYSLQKLASSIEHSLVSITGITDDVNWLAETYERKGQSSGLIVADTGSELLILSPIKALEGADRISVSLYNGKSAEVEIVLTDPRTGMAVISASKDAFEEADLEEIAPAVLGNSEYTGLKGAPIMALGSPMGVTGSLGFGIITAVDVPVYSVDSYYKRITTDIYGSRQAAGVLVNLQGQVVGIIDMSKNEAGLENSISAIGISELRPTIERLSNGKDMPYLGLVTVDIPESLREETGMPEGAYVMGVNLDSPAMNAGIQSGDIITYIDEKEIKGQRDYVDALSSLRMDIPANVVVMRIGMNDFRPIVINILPGIM